MHQKGHVNSKELSTEIKMAGVPPLVLKARHLSGSASSWIDISLPEQVVGWFALGLRLVVKDACRPTELSCIAH